MRVYVEARYGDVSKHGWRVRRRHQFSYVSPELWYEATVGRLVNDQTHWIDVGGGKALFPHDEALSQELAGRCKLLVGVDPSENIHHNQFAHERHQCFIEDFETDHVFDLATLRMVVEHIQHPRPVAERLASLVRPGGHVVIYTPNRWSICSLTASMTPHFIHERAAQFLWRAKDEDVFPTAYKMNTRDDLRCVFEEHGFQETGFAVLACCNIAQRSRLAHPIELALWRASKAMRIGYPETNLLGIYQRC